MSKTKFPKDTKANSSSGSSSASSFVDLKTTEKRIGDSIQPVTSTRSRSFLHCLGKHLGRHFPHHQHEQQTKQHKRQRCQNMLTIYNSEEDIHSSSTDSFSLSYERCSTHTPTHHMTGSNIDLSGEECSSGTSSASSGYSHYSSVVYATEPDDFWSKQNGRRHFFDETMYRRPASALGQFSTDEYSNNSHDDNEDDDQNQHDDQNDRADVKANSTRDNNKNTVRQHNHNQEQSKAKGINNIHSQSNMTSNSKCNSIETPQSRSRSISPCSITKGLHLSRISITSSVCRMFQNLTTSTSATTTRSLSWSSTPVRCSTKQSLQSNATATNLLKANSSKKTTSMSSTTFNGNAKKKDKKQQSILRPPVHYVYMKGMSGLYSRVPRYTACYPYTTTHQAT